MFSGILTIGLFVWATVMVAADQPSENEFLPSRWIVNRRLPMELLASSIVQPGCSFQQPNIYKIYEEFRLPLLAETWQRIPFAARAGCSIHTEMAQ